MSPGGGGEYAVPGLQGTIEMMAEGWEDESKERMSHVPRDIQCNETESLSALSSSEVYRGERQTSFWFPFSSFFESD